MQPGYGIPEIQQFTVDSTYFTSPNELNTPSQQKHHHHHLLQLQQPQQQQQQQSRSYSYQNLHPFLEFQDLQQPRVHHQQQQPPPPPPPPSQPPHLLLDAGPEIPSPRLFPFVSNFRHVVDANEPGCSRERQQHRHHHLADEDLSLGDDGLDRRWPREEVVGVKSPMDSFRGPVWKFSGFSYNEENRQTPETKRYRKGEENEPPESKNDCSTSYRLFNELELILSRELQAGSGSVLTGDNNPPPPAGNPSSAAETAGTHVDLASETSPDEEGSLRMMQQLEEQQLEEQRLRKKRRMRKQQQQLGSIAAFFEKLVNQLMEHQEALHRKFMDVMEKRDQERQKREEEWRRQEAARLTKERALRTQEEAAASTREAAILSFLEKFSAIETASLPPKRPDVTISQNGTSTQPETTSENNRESGGENRRWPKSEVNTLIKVRGRLEGKFQEPGLKGPLWEEVSTAMAAMGYERSPKRCKEKWENINKYFKKTKDNTKRRSKQSGTCPYFHQLDLLYSNKAVAASATGGLTNRELLDAMLPSGGSCKGEIDAGSGKSLMDNCRDENEEDRNEEEDDDDDEEEGEHQGDDEEEKEKQQRDERKRGKKKEREGQDEVD
ncbi:unnamed protein product [Victoria cruziana]